MNRILRIVLTVCALAVLLTLAGYAQDVVLLSPDTERAIVVSAQATAQERGAAQTLQKYLTQITGREMRVQTDDVKTAAAIAVGRTVYTPSDDSALPNGGYRIVFSDGVLCIYGAGEKGTRNGVYAFLRDCCGCRWYAPEEIVIPKADAVCVPANTDVTYRPCFEYTSSDWRTLCDPEVAAANGQTGNGCYIYGFCHTLSTRFCSRDKYFDAHPEYFALHGGKRTPYQLCLTNPETLRVVTEEVLDVLHSGLYDPDADLQIISLTQDDNGDYCECDACKALDKANGSHAGSNVTFANAVADAVKAAGFDNVAIDTFAYQYTRKTPTKVVPRDNVIIRLCSIECCFCHTLDDGKCKENRDFMRDLRDWGKICKRIYIWDYTTNYWETTCLYPDFGVLQRNMQIFYENNARGVFEEGEPSDDDNAEFGELRGYLIARLMQDPYMDYPAQMQEFLHAYYGDGGDALYRFLTRTIEKAGASYLRHLGTFPDSTQTLTRFTDRDVSYADAQWREAKENTKDTAYSARVERSEICWRYWKCSNRCGEFSLWRSTVFSRMRGRETLYRDLRRMGIAYINHTRRDRQLTECMTLVLLRRPGKWCKLYEESYWDMLESFVLQVYRLLGKLHGQAV